MNIIPFDSGGNHWFKHEKNETYAYFNWSDKNGVLMVLMVLECTTTNGVLRTPFQVMDGLP